MPNIKWCNFFIYVYRISADHYNTSNNSLDANGDNIQTNAYSVYKLLNNSSNQTSLNSFNETFHSGTNKLYSFNNTSGRYIFT